MCDSMFPISLLSLATTKSLSPFFAPFFFTFSLLQTKLSLYNAHPNCFFSSPLALNISPALSSGPESCSSSSLRLSSLCILKTFLPPNDRFLSSPSSLLPRPSRPDPVSLAHPPGLLNKDPLSLLVPTSYHPVSRCFSLSGSVDGIWMTAALPQRTVTAATRSATLLTVS